LRRYRVLAGLSQEALAERAGLSRRGIADLERGARRFPYPDTASVWQMHSSSAEPTAKRFWPHLDRAPVNVVETVATPG
jgi:transcriptional regulator with XRE-family HTH domain